jgi:hypothetical protein
MIPRRRSNLEDLLGGLIVYRVLQNYKSPNLYGMTQIGSDAVIGDFEDSLNPRKREQIYRAVESLPVDQYDKQNIEENLATKDYVAEVLTQYLSSKEGTQVAKNYGLDVSDLRPAAANLEEGVVAATTKQMYPYPIIKNTEDRDKFAQQVSLMEPGLSRYDIETLWMRHELRHLTQSPGLLASAAASLENRLFVETDNIGGLFKEYVQELGAATDYSEKETIAAKARVTLSHYLATTGVLNHEQRKQYNINEHLLSIARECQKSLSDSDYRILFG